MLHYTTRLFVDGEDVAITHQQDILDACDKLVDLVAELETDTKYPLKLRNMIDKHAASLIRTCYDQVLMPGQEHYVLITQPGLPMITLIVRREADLPDAPSVPFIEVDPRTERPDESVFEVITMGSPV